MIIQNILFILACAVSLNVFSNPFEHAEGRQLYQVYCVQCHGIEGDGYGINVADMEVLPKDHTDVKEMRTRTDEDLFKAIKFGGKAIDKSVLMPAWDGNLSDEQIHELVKYLRLICCQKKTK